MGSVYGQKFSFHRTNYIMEAIEIVCLTMSHQLQIPMRCHSLKAAVRLFDLTYKELNIHEVLFPSCSKGELHRSCTTQRRTNELIILPWLHGGRLNSTYKRQKNIIYKPLSNAFCMLNIIGL